MRPSNPACYECPKGEGGLHTWKLNPNGTATCKHCSATLNKQDTAEVFHDWEAQGGA
jgi:hypothetical protein